MNKLSHTPAMLERRPVSPRIGCAGWAIPRDDSERFPRDGSHLERYAKVFNAVEVNSSFYRTHLPRTYARWAASVSEDFRFSVKFPRSITHDARLKDCGGLLEDFLGGVEMLGPRLGCLLLQLPPSLRWNAQAILSFLAQLRDMHRGPVVCEPRHLSWFQAEASQMLAAHHVSRVAADPATCARARVPAGDQTLQYLRLHGSPRMYRDSYAESDITWIASRLRRTPARTVERWCIFDNTAHGHAVPNALALMDQLDSHPAFTCPRQHPPHSVDR
ncbi:MAG: DUF72 domain-containing protein [Rhodanobacter sp.]